MSKPGQLTIILILTFVTNASAQTIKFFSSDRDLSNSMITAIAQDRSGLVWIATEDGLNRFDGLNFVTYRNRQNDPGSLLSSFVRTLYVDKSGRLWVGCINGLMLFDADKNAFNEIMLYRDTMRLRPHVTSIIENSGGDIMVATSGQGLIVVKKGQSTGHADMRLIPRLSSEFLEFIYEDFYGRLWIGTENQGLNLYNPSTNELTLFKHQPTKEGSISSNYITSIMEDYRRNIFIGTVNSGLNQFIETNNSFRVIPVSGASPYDMRVASLFADDKNNLWVGTSGQGLWRFNHQTETLQPHNIASTRFDVDKSKIHAITKDHEGNLWLGVFLKGVIFIPGKTNNFNTITYQQFSERSIGSGCITAIAQDPSGLMWVGTDTDGIYQIDHLRNQISNFQINSRLRESLPVSVTSLMFDQKGILWAGTSLDGFFSFNPKTGESRFFKNQPDNDNSLSNNKVQCISQDRQGNLWIGTSGGGLNKFDPATGLFTRFKHDPNNSNTLCNNWVNNVFCDSEGLIWIGTYNRVSVYNPKTGTFGMLGTGNGMLPNNIVYFINEDSAGNIWFGTNHGLARHNKQTNSSEFFSKDQGLTNNVITAFLEDNNKQLWISTHQGISCLSIVDGSVVNYFVHDGLQGNEFRRKAAYRTKKGELFFGGINGLTWFVPEQIHRDQHIPEVYLTDLIVQNNSVPIGQKVGNRVILKKSIEKTDTLKLSWQHKNFNIEFSTIGFSNPERITYQYRLLGFDDNWVSTGTTNRRATYTNLKPGRYIFEVRAANTANYSNARRLVVLITPPWWETWWFKIVYFALFTFIVYAVYHYIISRIKHRNELQHHEHQEKMNEAKMQFFTNISHEIRTPLTLIASPLEKLMSENKNDHLSKSYLLMSRNTHRLMRLVNQMLDVSKIDRDQMLISYAQTDLVKFIAEIMHAFDYLAEKKEIKYTFNTSLTEMVVWVDSNNLDKVLYNVISNAFKFTPNGGEIELNLKTGKNHENEGFLKEFAEITVSDTGPGIEDEKLGRIFERFYQSDNHASSNTGTGIGLHISRSLIEMQHGKIMARNRTSRSGCIFYIHLPLGHFHVANAQISKQPVLAMQRLVQEKTLEHIETAAETDENVLTAIKSKRKTGYKILIADDDEQMRAYLKDELGDFFSIIECANGKDALDAVHNKKPDLVVSDVVMPVMDGVALCRKLKSNPATSHLPVILLTSHPKNEDLGKALDVGADAYFVKPFNMGLLRKNINNLLVNRERIKIKYSPSGNISMKEKEFMSSDQALMNKIMQVIETRISDSMLSAETLSQEVGMSRVHLFRKLKKITGQSPSDFIRRIRLQKAARLLEENTGYIKEIAFEVGFTSLSYFSSCFHEFYGVKPSEFAKLKKEKTNEELTAITQNQQLTKT